MSKRGLMVLLFCAVLLGMTSAANAQKASTIAIEHVTVIDGTGRPAIPDATVIIEGDRISRVSRTQIPIPAGAQVIDEGDRTLSAQVGLEQNLLQLVECLIGPGLAARDGFGEPAVETWQQRPQRGRNRARTALKEFS